MTVVFLLFREISDKYGTSELVGAFSERWRAERHEFDHIQRSRCEIKEVAIDALDMGRPSIVLPTY